MEFKVYREVFLKELNLLQGAVEGKVTIPILGNVRLEAGANGSVSLAATNLEMTIQSSCKAAVTTPGKGTVPAKKLLDLMNLLPDGEVSFKLLENSWVEITFGKKRYKLVGLSPEHFPALQAVPKQAAAIKAVMFAALIDRVMYSISSEESRYVINGALFVFTKDSVTAVATDGHRMSIAKSAGEFSGAPNGLRVIIPRRALAEVSALAKEIGDGEINFASDTANLFFSSGDRMIIARQLTGQFPAYENVLPRGNDKIVTLNRAELLGTIQRVAQLSDERTNAVRFSLGQGSLDVSSSSPEYGEANETIETAYSGVPIVIGFNARYVADFLGATTVEYVTLALKDSNAAGDFRPVGEADYEYVVMPMRV